jgi:signal transduction histidine kinase
MINPSTRVLLIEDLPVYLVLVKRLLSMQAIELDSASSLADGLEKARSGCFDAVLLDLGLPDSSGLSTFSRFQSHFANLPVIIFSGLDDESLASLAVQHGAQDYIIKGNYLTQGDAGSKLLARAIHYAIERHNVQTTLLRERILLEERVAQRTAELDRTNQHLRQLMIRFVSAQEDERRRVSLELHDEAGQALTALKLTLDLIHSDIPESLDQISSSLKGAISMVDNTIEQVRSLAQNLRPPSLDSLGLHQCLRGYCHNLGQRCNHRIEYQGNCVDDLPGYIQISLYRVVQEALNNAIKHANAEHICVSLECDAEGVKLIVSDTGLGFMPDALPSEGPGSGIGLSGMRERIEALGGTFDINTGPGKGTCIIAYVPLEEAV